MTPSFMLKYERGDLHLKELNRTYHVWTETHPYKVSVEEDNEGKIVVARITDDPSDAMLPLMGDVIHNLHCSLDHVALHIAEKAFGGPLSDDDERDSVFPLFLEPKGFGRRLAHVPPGAQAIIEAAQPYHRGHKATSHPLGQLCELSNIEKHRRLPLIATYVTPSSFTIEPDEPGVLERVEVRPFGKLEDGTALVARFRFRGPETPVNMKGHLNMNVAFGARSPTGIAGLEVGPSLDGIRDYIAYEVLNPLERFT